MVSVCFPVAAQAVQQALLAMFSVDDDAQFHISDDWKVWLLVAAFDINTEVKRLGFDLQPAETTSLVSFLQQQPHPLYAARGKPFLICFGGHVRDI